MITVFLFIAGFLFILKGAALLVDGASALAKKMRVSDLVIGLTVVAFGTSTPELVVNIFASIKNEGVDIAIGNIVGSNIANILLILGIAALIYPLSVQKNTKWKEIPFSFLAALGLGIMANDALIDKENFSIISRIDGLILLAFFIIFLYYTFGIARSGDVSLAVETKSLSTKKALLLVTIGLVGLVLGGKWVVDGAIFIASYFGVSSSLIGLTVVAVGTSLPELATSAVAAYKKNTDIAIGNVVGSNIYNIFWILGLSAVINPLPFKTQYNFDVGIMILASFLLFSFMFTGKKNVLERFEGAVLIFLYLAYVTVLVIQG